MYFVCTCARITYTYMYVSVCMGHLRGGDKGRATANLRNVVHVRNTLAGTYPYTRAREFELLQRIRDIEGWTGGSWKRSVIFERPRQVPPAGPMVLEA